VGGIINYYHGEAGQAIRRMWTANEEHLTYQMVLSDDPHRESVYDYGTDIGIDPAIQVGDKVIYIRLDDTCGIWVQRTNAFGPALHTAIDRVKQNRGWMDSYAKLEKKGTAATDKWLVQLQERTGVAFNMEDDSDDPRVMKDRPATEASIFVSYSSKNILMARQIYGDLRNDAKAEVWFDLAQPGESTRNDEQIAMWLQTAIYKSRGLVLLLTEAALKSSWVRREVEWAKEQAQRNQDFRLIVLKLADITIPEPIAAAGPVIDCLGLWKSNGINEELYAALFRRGGRRAWLEHQRELPANGLENDEGFSYADFESDSGTVIDFHYKLRQRGLFRFWKRQKTLSWHLTYASDGKTKNVSGVGEDEPIDLSIKPGNHIGSFVCRRRWGTHLHEGVLLWMRTQGLDVTPDDVLDVYYETLLGTADQFSTDRAEIVVRRTDAWGRSLSELWIHTKDKRKISYTKLMRMNFTRRFIESQ